MRIDQWLLLPVEKSFTAWTWSEIKALLNARVIEESAHASNARESEEEQAGGGFVDGCTLSMRANSLPSTVIFKAAASDASEVHCLFLSGCLPFFFSWCYEIRKSHSAELKICFPAKSINFVGLSFIQVTTSVDGFFLAPS